jgi:cation diffusion facilitator family transporter
VAVSQRRRLAVVLALNVAMIAVLVVVGLAAGSLAVVGEGADFAADSVGLLLGLVAVTIRDRVGAHSRAPVVVAAVNGVALLAVTVVVVAGAVRRLVLGTPEVHGLAVLVVSAVAAAVMVAGALVLGRDAGSEDLHMRSVLLDTVADAVAAAAVAATGALILVAPRLAWLDSAVAVVVGLVVVVAAVRLLRDVVRSLRTGAPLEVDDD